MTLQEFLLTQDYFDLKEIPGRGLCGLHRMAYTVGLFYNLTKWDYKGRYCFHNLAEAKEALNTWTGVDDPLGNWIKHKGEREYSNPNYEPINQY